MEAKRLWVVALASPLRIALAGFVVKYGVKIKPINAPNKPKRKRYCSTGIVPGEGSIFQEEPIRCPQILPTIAIKTMPNNRKINSADIIIAPE